MRLVKVNKVINVSSQDKCNPVVNIIKNEPAVSTISSKWLSSPTHKVQYIEAEFLLEEAAIIRCIELGNCGSSSIEIMAKNTAWPLYKPYVTLLPCTTLRTFEDVKTNVNFETQKEFTEEKFSKEAVGMKFDQIKVICGQPYTESFQYGLSFLHFKADEIRLHYSIDDFYSGRSIPPLFDRIRANTTTPKTYSSRGRQMVDIALSHNSNNTSNVAEESSHANESESFDFSLKVTLFLTDPHCSKKSAHVSVNELMRLFERKHGHMLLDTQKEEFRQIYSSLYSQANIFPESFKSSLSETFGTPVNNSSSSNRKRGKHIPCNPNQISNGGDIENDTSFDVDFTPKKKAKTCQKNLFGSENVSSSVSQTIITLEDDDEPSSSSGSYRPEDFVQSDGSVPSTSKAVSFVDCPICAQEFHVSDIEKHAATCENFKPSTGDSDDDDDNSSPIYNQTVYYTYRYGTKC